MDRAIEKKTPQLSYRFQQWLSFLIQKYAKYIYFKKINTNPTNFLNIDFYR